MTVLLALLALWTAVAVAGAGLLARVLSGARRVEARALAAPGVPPDAPALVALGIALPSPRRAEEPVLT